MDNTSLSLLCLSLAEVNEFGSLVAQGEFPVAFCFGISLLLNELLFVTITERLRVIDITMA